MGILKNKKLRKGQGVMTDFILAIIILVVILQISTTAWTRNIENLPKRENRIEIENLALSIGNMLIKSQGVPGDWSEGTVVSLGLADELNILNPSKITTFTNLEKTTAKGLLGLEGYNFTFTLRDNGAVLVEYGEQWGGAKEIVVVRRLVLYNDEPAFMELRLWKEG